MIKILTSSSQLDINELLKEKLDLIETEAMECDSLLEEDIDVFVKDINNMTEEEHQKCYDFIDNNPFIVDPDKKEEMSPYCYLWDNWRNNLEFDEMIKRSKLKDNSEKKVYIYTLVEADETEWIIDGYHYVNRLGYFFSKKKVEIPEEGLRYW